MDSNSIDSMSNKNLKIVFNVKFNVRTNNAVLKDLHIQQ